MTDVDRVIDVVNDLRNQLEFKVDSVDVDGTECGETFLPNGRGFACCTNSARLLQKKLGGKVMGYFHRDNLTAELGETEGGHDFLVLPGMVVDLWASEYYDSPLTVHLKHEATVRRLYGDTNLWKEVR